MQNRCHGLNEFAHDIQVDRMLICADFWYFGSQPKALPAQLFERLHIGRGHRRTQDPDIIESLVAWLKGFPCGPPCRTRTSLARDLCGGLCTPHWLPVVLSNNDKLTIMADHRHA